MIYFRVDVRASLDNSAYVAYPSSNEDIQEAVVRLFGKKGRGFFVAGGFDQVASLLASADLEFACLIDKNQTALDYAKLRLALAELSPTQEENFSSLTSPKIVF